MKKEEERKVFWPVPGPPQCQTMIGEDGEQRCPGEATHVVEGLPGHHWSGRHCDEHVRSMVLDYDHQGGCVVRVLR